MHVGISTHMHIAAHAPIGLQPRWAPVGDATEQADMKSSQGESVSDAEPDEALKAFEALMTANDIIIRSAFYYILLPSLFAMALPLLLYELLELHDRRRL